MRTATRLPGRRSPSGHAVPGHLGSIASLLFLNLGLGLLVGPRLLLLLGLPGRRGIPLLLDHLLSGIGMQFPFKNATTQSVNASKLTYPTQGKFWEAIKGLIGQRNVN